MGLSRKLLIAAAALVYALVFGEVFVRIFAPEPLLPRNVTGSSWGVRQNVPGAVYRQVTEDVDVGVRINSQGMRADRDYPSRPPAGTCRIAITGDSFIIGYEAEARDTIAGLLDGEMAKRGYRTETLNFGVSGFGNSEQLVQFERRIAGFNPAVLVQAFHQTDFDDNLRAGLYVLGKDGRLEARAQSYLPGVAISDRLMAIPPYRWLDAHSQLFAAMRQKATEAAKSLLAKLRDPGRAVKTNQARREAEAGGVKDAPRPGQALAAALLRATQASASAMGVDWYLFGIPTRTATTEYEDYADLLALTPEARARYVTPIARFRGRDNALFYQPNGHHHFTPLGNRIGAQMLADRIAAMSAARLASCRIAAPLRTPAPTPAARR